MRRFFVSGQAGHFAPVPNVRAAETRSLTVQREAGPASSAIFSKVDLKSARSVLGDIGSDKF
jgi:hypothetical protein